DFLEEKFGLGHTAALLRLAELKELPKQELESRDFCFFPLTEDVFLWFTQGRLPVNPRKFETKPCTVVGLYTHPPGQPSVWCKITRLLVGEDDPSGKPGLPWDPVSKPNPHIEAAKKELAEYTDDPVKGMTKGGEKPSSSKTRKGRDKGHGSQT